MRLAAVFLLGIATTSPAAHQDRAEGRSESFRKAARQVAPAVVTVRALGVGDRPFDLDPGGSGFIIDAARGLVLTNDHVIRAGGRVVVTLADGRERGATRVR